MPKIKKGGNNLLNHQLGNRLIANKIVVLVGLVMMFMLFGMKEGYAATDFVHVDNGDDTVTITEYVGGGGDVIIPDEIEGKSVAVIGENVFHTGDNGNITSVTLPNNLKFIEKWAFAKNQLVEISIPNSVEKIGDHAFGGNKLKTVKLSNNLANIGEYAFAYNNDVIEKIEIPSNVEGIGQSAFFKSKIKELVLNEGLKKISNSAFEESGLTSIVIPNTVEEIGNSAFLSNNLSDISIPGSVTSIGSLAFADNQLSKVKIIRRDTSIDDAAFVNNQLPSDFIIHGYFNSTAHNYAVNNSHTFVPISDKKVIVGEEIGNVMLNEVIEVLNKDGNRIAWLKIPNEYKNIYNSTVTLEVKSVDDPNPPGGYLVGGPVLDFIFKDSPDGNEIEVEGDFILSMLVNEDAKYPAIFHYESEKWVQKGGSYSNGFITADVTDFSKYGVFSQERIDITVTKKWVGTPGDPVTAYLLINGERYLEEVAELSDDNNWTYTFYNMLGESINEYSIEEVEVPGYESTITGNATEGFIITNTEIVPGQTPKEGDKEGVQPEVPEGQKLPATASPYFNMLLIGFVLLLVGGSIYMIRRKRIN